MQLNEQVAVKGVHIPLFWQGDDEQGSVEQFAKCKIKINENVVCCH